MKTKLLCSVFCILFFFPVSHFSKRLQNRFDAKKIERLLSLCKLWGQVKYFHPSLAYRTDIDWDKALVEAIPQVSNAKSSSDYKLALQNLLNLLGDPLNKISGESETTVEKNENRNLNYRLTEDGILLISIGDYFSLTSSESQKTLGEITVEIPKSKAIVFDLRSDEPIGDYGNVIFNIYFSRIERMFNSEPLTTPGERRRVYYGYENFSDSASGQYRTGFFTENNSRLTPLKNSKDIPTIFILNKNGGLFRSTSALQVSGKSLVVFDGKDVSVGKTTELNLSEGLTAQIRTGEPIFEDGTDASLQADLIAEKNAVENAMKLARDFKSSTIKRKKLPITTVSIHEKSYPEMKFPSPEYRLLAAFRIWNVIHYFFPYKNLMERDWEEVLREFIPKFEEAKNEVEYTLTVAEMMTQIHDSHAYLNSPVYNEYIGTGYPPIRVRKIEDKLIVTSFRDEKAATLAGIEIGDEVIKVDGEDAKSRFARYAKYISASTPQSNLDKSSISFMNGKPDSTVTLTLHKANNTEKQVKLVRHYEDYTTLYHRERTGEILKVLPGNIGYADLDRLSFDMVDEMFEKFKNTKAIIFDMRGYPNGVVWTIAPRLTNKQSKAALFETPLVGHNLPDEESSAKFFQKIQPTPPGKSIYQGQTVMLIDERAASQAEHSGLLLRAANGTKFVGSHTTGVNGEITTFTTPGAITIGFTGQSVKFPDGKQLQRIGLVPDIFVKPTVKGIRENRDEVLEKAIQFLENF